jgi:hypothetical protein
VINLRGVHIRRLPKEEFDDLSRMGGLRCLKASPPPVCFECTRSIDHTGRHIATGPNDEAYAAWEEEESHD